MAEFFVRKRKRSCVAGVAFSNRLGFSGSSQFGSSSLTAEGSMTLPESMWAPISLDFSRTRTRKSSLPASLASCFSFMAALRPAGPAERRNFSCGRIWGKGGGEGRNADRHQQCRRPLRHSLGLAVAGRKFPVHLHSIAILCSTTVARYLEGQAELERAAGIDSVVELVESMSMLGGWYGCHESASPKSACRPAELAMKTP